MADCMVRKHLTRCMGAWNGDPVYGWQLLVIVSIY